MAKGPRKTTTSVRSSVTFTFFFLAINWQMNALINQITAGMYAPIFCSPYITCEKEGEPYLN